jgi:hypothetical protein
MPIARSALRFAVLRSIHFDDKSGGRTRKIDDEISNRHLASKMGSRRLKTLQGTPKSHLSVGCIAAQPASGAAFKFIDCR